jgi:ABC-type oligopeptide transport system substrate-binding subunit
MLRRRYSSNFAGLKDPVVDALVAGLDRAESREELGACVRALDRVLQWGYYSIPLWYSSLHTACALGADQAAAGGTGLWAGIFDVVD